MKQAFYADYIWYDSSQYENSWLLTENGIVEGVSDDETALSRYDKTVFANSSLFPGLINTHTHLAMSAFRGLADDFPLMTWLQEYIWPAERKYISPEFVYYWTLLSAAECIRSGVTCVNDMYYHCASAADALRDAGLRGVVGLGVMGSEIDGAFRLAEEFDQDDMIKVSLCPHALYTVEPEAVARCVEFAENKNICLHTHLAETADETQLILEKYGKTPAMLMDGTGAFDYKGSIFAHCVHLTDDEIALMGKKHVNISHCLESNLKLGSGFAPVCRLIKAGANVTIGTDGAASNNDQSVIGEMSSVSRFHKAFNKDARALPAPAVLEMATSNSAKALCYNNIGSLKKGNSADFFVLSFDSVHMTPVYNPVSQLIYAAESGDITDVYVNGRPLMKDGVLLTIDEEKVKKTARKNAEAIKG